MNNNLPTRISVAIVTGAALSAIVLSQGSVDRAPAQPAPSVSVASLLGNQILHTNDERFRPVAMAVVHEAESGRASAGVTFVRETIYTDAFNKYLIVFPPSIARATPMRPLTPSEAVLLEELFSSDLHNANNVMITRNGINGVISARDLGVKVSDLAQKAKARATEKSQWYNNAAKSAGPEGQ